MLTLMNGEIVEVTKLDPEIHFETGEVAERAVDWMQKYGHLNLLGDAEVTDLLSLVCEMTGGLADPKMVAIYGFYYGMYAGMLVRKKEEEARQIWVSMDPEEKQ